ncbi:MAG: lysophospholipase [Spirochaetes bacterium]|nr:lysophospholipase [Spirochaetota bacterium]
MKHIENTFKGVRNTDIYYQVWLPAKKAKAVLLIVHGIGEHSGRYMNVVNHFVPLGYAVYALDHIGHGRSGGTREFVKRFEDYTDTLSIYYNIVKAAQPAQPIFLLGHSMGGLIAAYFLLDHQADFKGAVISAPSIKVGDISKAAVIAGKIFALIAPKAGVLKINSNGISRDPEVVKAYQNDPLVFHRKTTARLGAELLKAITRVNAELERISLPFIVLQGSADRIIDPSGAQMLYDRAASKDKTIKIYNGLYHEVFNEPEKDRVLKDVERWIEARV